MLIIQSKNEPFWSDLSLEYENENFNSECTVTLDNDTDLEDVMTGLIKVLLFEGYPESVIAKEFKRCSDYLNKVNED